MMGIALLDVRRILRSRATWALLALALAVLALQNVRMAYGIAADPGLLDFDTSWFRAYLPPGAPDLGDAPYLIARETSPSLRLMLSFTHFHYVALAAIVIFGGFFAHDVGSGYTALRRCRGLSPQRQFAANVMTILVVSSVFTAIAVIFLYVVCLCVNPQGVNSLANGQLVLQSVGFLPQVAAAAPIAYIALFWIINTGILTFLGMIGYFVARLSGRVLVASISPAAFVLALGGLLAARLPWPFRVFDYENLSFAGRGITSFDVAAQYVGTYFIWLGAFFAAGLLGPALITSVRRARK